MKVRTRRRQQKGNIKEQVKEAAKINRREYGEQIRETLSLLILVEREWVQPRKPPGPEGHD